ncbi:hypothetical protein [Sansalvadorimonas verongulae]|uniref:hypothetical protein n=1 Tax=Sansalvadorimonas verongulae TaxID=2172824 RepID=UPI0012BD6CA2|nr:hypothetical protein [Sansalvadorimonas verongulae]MTI13324.1 hypothetical protein [Sansalvadorimonas verongulae]
MKRFLNSLFALTALSLLCAGSSADVIWNKCIIPENIYVTKHDSKVDFAKMKASIDELDRQTSKYNMSMRNYPGVWGWVSDWGYDTWDVAKERLLYNHSSPRMSFFAIVVDPHKKNISLMITSEHQNEKFHWIGDNQVFIDGKTNRYADFRCSGSGLYLQWKGRDLLASNEFFDSAIGSLSARLENYTNKDTGQDFYFLRVATLENDYPYTGVYDAGVRAYKSWWNKATSYPHNRHYRYDPRDPQCDLNSPHCMMPMLRPGYDVIDRTQTSHDVAKLAHYVYETSSQNSYDEHQPVSITTIRTMLSSLRTSLRSQSLNFSHTAFQGKSLHELINEADESVAAGMSSEGIDQDIHYKAAGDQLVELEALINNNRDILDNTQDGVGSIVGEVYQSKVAINNINKMVSALNDARMSAALTRNSVNESKIRKARIDTDIIPHDKLSGVFCEHCSDDDSVQDEDDYDYADDDFDTCAEGDDSSMCIRGDEGEEEPAIATEEELGCQLTNGVQIANYRPRRGDNRFSFNTGISVRVAPGNTKPMVYLQSTETPWRRFFIYNDPKGVDYIIPEQDVWCRGALFGVDHTSGWPNTGVLRITIRGIYDNVRHEMYVGSVWSTWSQNWTISYLLSAYSIITPIGGTVGALAGAAMTIPALGAPAAGVLALTALSANVLMTALTPYASREVKWNHSKVVDGLFLDSLLGPHYSHGTLNSTYYSTFGTLLPDGNIH